MVKIFISYRRADSADTTTKLYDRLAVAFGAENVFYDVDKMQRGDNFPEVLREWVSTSDVVLTVIGTRWLTVQEHDGRRRIDNPKDWVRQETQLALERGSDVLLIPTLVDGMTMPQLAGDALPKPLRPLLDQDAQTLKPDRLHEDVSALIRAIRQRFGLQAKEPVDQRRSYRLLIDVVKGKDWGGAREIIASMRATGNVPGQIPLDTIEQAVYTEIKLIERDRDYEVQRFNAELLSLSLLKPDDFWVRFQDYLQVYADLRDNDPDNLARFAPQSPAPAAPPSTLQEEATARFDPKALEAEIARERAEAARARQDLEEALTALETNEAEAEDEALTYPETPEEATEPETPSRPFAPTTIEPEAAPPSVVKPAVQPRSQRAPGEDDKTFFMRAPSEYVDEILHQYGGRYEPFVARFDKWGTPKLRWGREIYTDFTPEHVLPFVRDELRQARNHVPFADIWGKTVRYSEHVADANGFFHDTFARMSDVLRGDSTQALSGMVQYYARNADRPVSCWLFTRAFLFDRDLNDQALIEDILNGIVVEKISAPPSTLPYLGGLLIMMRQFTRAETYLKPLTEVLLQPQKAFDEPGQAQEMVDLLLTWLVLLHMTVRQITTRQEYLRQVMLPTSKALRVSSSDAQGLARAINTALDQPDLLAGYLARIGMDAARARDLLGVDITRHEIVSDLTRLREWLKGRPA
jgi:hypothetical protein